MGHEVIGWLYRAWDGGSYRCTRWVRNQGYWMRSAQRETCVSERAIGRTYHRLPDREQPAEPPEHEQPCDCQLCRSGEV